ncbi:transglutaminase-like domain-containing protein [Mesonia aquimarina]|uniref:transglutaminase-like domain-containing protein n=1 Tax=Mesonia aquimarina TaxID=1504967 RepID=UPI000EF5EBE1|nr:transglutaminase-like domain-containing protein [Mesonia aquimarina]
MVFHKQLLILLFIPIICFSQKHRKPEPEIIEEALSLKEKYPDDEIVVSKSVERILFDYKRDQVIVENNTQEELINIDTKAYIRRYSFYDGSSEIKDFDVEYINGRNANVEIEDIAYQDDELFHTDTRLQYVVLDFPLQGFEYKIETEKVYNDLKYFTSIYFNDEHPVKEKTIKIEVPNWLDIQFKEVNFENVEIEKEVKKNEDFTGYTYKATNLPARFKEKHSLGPTYIYPHLLVLPKRYKLDGIEKNIFSSVQDQYNWYKSLVNNLDYAKKPYAKKVAELTEGVTSKEEKIKNIFYWIQDNIRYIAFEDGIAGFQPEQASEVFDKRYGDCKGMANLTKAMLSEIGVDARLTWIGTNHIAYDYSTPNLAVDNHMICSVLDKEKIIFLDATEKFSPYKEYANRIQGKQALIENGKQYIIKEVPVLDSEKSVENKNINLKIVEDDLVGKAKLTYTGESRKQVLNYLNTLQSDIKEDFLKYFLEEGNSSVKANNIKPSNLRNREGDMVITYDILFNDKIYSFGKKTYLDLNLVNIFSDYFFEDRKSSYVFSHKKTVQSELNIDITGYKILEMPTSLSFKDENVSVEIILNQVDNNLEFQQNMKILNEVISAEELESWNKKMEQIANFFNQQIILQKS